VDLKHRFVDVETDCRDRLHDWLPNRGGPQQHPHSGTHVPVEEPSTASIADIRCLNRSTHRRVQAATMAMPLERNSGFLSDHLRGERPFRPPVVTTLRVGERRQSDVPTGL
jgi:hypothetical protein